VFYRVAFFIVIKMVQDVFKMIDDKWPDYYVLMVQQAYKKEIEQAVEKVKGSTPETKSEGPLKRRKRGYWTPVGFYWFRRKRKWHVKDRLNSRGTDRGQVSY